MPPPPGRSRADAEHGFSLLELTISILVVAILAVMLFPVFTSIQARAERAKCMGNLRSLHVAANLYTQDNHHWPQIKSSEGVDTPEGAGPWLDALRPYGLEQINWICPTKQHLLGGLDLSLPANKRCDYAASTFNTNAQAPYIHSNQPWFAEIGNLHGNGNLMIFPDGHIESLNEFLDHTVLK